MISWVDLVTLRWFYRTALRGVRKEHSPILVLGLCGRAMRNRGAFAKCHGPSRKPKGTGDTSPWGSDAMKRPRAIKVMYLVEQHLTRTVEAKQDKKRIFANA